LCRFRGGGFAQRNPSIAGAVTLAGPSLRAERSNLGQDSGPVSASTGCDCRVASFLAMTELCDIGV
jgi:hypothetical protein